MHELAAPLLFVIRSDCETFAALRAGLTGSGEPSRSKALAELVSTIPPGLLDLSVELVGALVVKQSNMENRIVSANILVYLCLPDGPERLRTVWVNSLFKKAGVRQRYAIPSIFKTCSPRVSSHCPGLGYATTARQYQCSLSFSSQWLI